MVASMTQLVCVLSCLFVFLATINGGCLNDGDLPHTSADWVQRMWSYSSSRYVAPSTSSDLTFMTFNLQSGYHFNCVNDAAAQAALMISSDYVGTQETVQGVDTRCSRCQIAKVIADTTGMATRFGMAMPYRTGQYGLGVGTTQTIVDTKYVLTNYTGYEPRIAIAVKTFPAALQSKSLWFVTLHIEYYSGTVRQNQIKDIVAFIESEILSQDPQATIVMVGDYNGGPWDPVYAFLQSKGFQNSWERFHGSILDGNTIPVDYPGSRFDHIWFRVPSTVTVTVKNAEVPNVLLSDHRPYRATLSFSVAGTSSTPAPPPAQPSTKAPTAAPTSAPTAAPTSAPTAAPTAAPNGTVVCVGPILETYPVTIACPISTQKISSVQFASYGNPTGTCGNYKLGTCIGGSSVPVVVDKCVGRNTCTFPISNNVFGDPCPRNGKHFFTQVLCV